MLGDNTGIRGHIATDQVPLCWSLDFDLCKILFVLDLLERSCCISCGMSVCNIQLNK